MSDNEEFDDFAGNRIAGAQSREAIAYVVKNIVDDPDSVSVDTTENGDNVKLTVHVAPDDKGKVIGRRGRIANALRTFARSVGARENVHTSVDIPDE